MKIRNDIIKEEDRNKTWKIHNGKKWINRHLTDPSVLGRRWGERVKTRKPCVKGANKTLLKRKTVSNQKK